MSKNLDYWLEIIKSKPEDIGIVEEKLSKLTKEEINEEFDFEWTLSQGAPFNIYSPHTPLMLASRIGRLDIIKLLIENEAEVDRANNYGFTSLMCASQNGHLEVAKFLVELGADVEKESGLYTSLILASQKGQLEVVKFLVEQGADVNHLREYYSPLSWALWNIRDNPDDSTKIAVAQEIIKTLLTSTKYNLDLPNRGAVEVVKDILHKAPLFVPFMMPEVFSKAEDPGIIQAMVGQNLYNLRTSVASIDGLFNEIYLIKMLFSFLGDGQEEFELEAASKAAMQDVDGVSLSQDPSSVAYVELIGGD